MRLRKEEEKAHPKCGEMDSGDYFFGTLIVLPTLFCMWHLDARKSSTLEVLTIDRKDETGCPEWVCGNKAFKIYYPKMSVGN